MSLVLTWGQVRLSESHASVVSMRPRSKDTEVIDGVELPSFRGEHVNGIEPTLEARERIQVDLSILTSIPPRRLTMPEHSSMEALQIFIIPSTGILGTCAVTKIEKPTRPFERAFWMLWILWNRRVSQGKELSELLSFSLLMKDSCYLMRRPTRFKSTGVGTTSVPICSGLVTEPGSLTVHMSSIFEELRTRWVSKSDRCSRLSSSNFLKPWSPESRRADHLITRMGADKVADGLPVLIEAVERAGRQVVWSCDPMHGNTESTSSGSRPETSITSPASSKKHSACTTK